MASDAWLEFQQARSEVSELFSWARTLPATPRSGQRISSQENALRAAIVLLVGHFHGYLQHLLEEWADSLVPDWNKLSPIQRNYVAKQLRRRLARILDDVGEEDLGEANRRQRFVDDVGHAAGWAIDPSSLSISAEREALLGFFTTWKSKAITRALGQFRGDDSSVFEWMVKSNKQYTGYYNLLDSLIDIRNDAAHGDATSRTLTLHEARQYRVLVNRLVHRAEAFVNGAP